MQTRDKVAIYLTIIPVVFVIMGVFLLSNTDEGVTAAAVSQLNKITIGSINEEARITEDILLKKDIGGGTSSVTTTIAGVSTTISGSSTTIQSQFNNTGSSSTTSIVTSSTSTTIQPTVITFIPKYAVDNLFSINQVMPDDGDFDGTVDVSNNDGRWLGNDGEYIEVQSWVGNVSSQANIDAAVASCEVDYTNRPIAGNIEFSYNTGSGWSSWICSQPATEQTIFSCNLKQYGVDTGNEVNNLRLRCRKQGGKGFSVDYIEMVVGIS